MRTMSIVRPLVASFAFVSIAACKEPPTPNPNPPPTPSPQPTAGSESSLPKLKAGDAAPMLVVTASNGTKIDIGDLTTKQKSFVLVYFYPKDDTPGCTAEACAFRDAWKKLEAAKVVVVGVSEDDDASHKAFAAKYTLPIPLVADTDGSIAKRFGVPLKSGYAMRWSFLVAPDGNIKKVYPDVDPAVHCDEVLRDVGFDATPPTAPSPAATASPKPA